MARKAEGLKIPSRRSNVNKRRKKRAKKAPRRVNPPKAVAKKKRKAAKKRPIAKAKKRPPIAKKPAPKKPAKRRAPSKAKPAKRSKRKPQPAGATGKIIPKGWKKLPAYKPGPINIERLAAQLAQRIGEKIVGGGHELESIEGKILLALSVAEQQGRLSREFYMQAGEHEGYDTPQEVYELWIYSGA